MTDNFFHPDEQALESFAARELDGGDAAVVESHLLGCAACSGAVEEWRTLFSALDEVPLLEPSADFADRVMARVTVRKPLPVQAAELVDRLVPHSRRGWALVGTALGLPAVGAIAIMAWIASLPWLTVEGLASFAVRQLGEGLETLPQRGLGLVSDTTIGVWLNETLQLVLGAGTGPLSAAAALFAAAVALSVWVLYKNLFRTPSRDYGNANYCF